MGVAELIAFANASKKSGQSITRIIPSSKIAQILEDVPVTPAQ